MTSEKKKTTPKRQKQKELAIASLTSAGEFQDDWERWFESTMSNNEGDVLLSVNDVTFTAHSIVLSARSPVFRAMLTVPMKEAKDRKVDIEDVSPDAFRAFLRYARGSVCFHIAFSRFLYTGRLPDEHRGFSSDIATSKSASSSSSSSSADAMTDEKAVTSVSLEELAVLGDRYQVQSLVDYASTLLEKQINAENVVARLMFAEKLDLASLTESCMDFVRTHPKMLKKIMASPDFQRLDKAGMTLLMDAIASPTSAIKKKRSVSFDDDVQERARKKQRS